MKRQVCTSAVLFSLLSIAPMASAKPASLASEVVGSYKPAAPAGTAEARVAAAKAFLGALNDDLRAQAQLELDSPERAKWTNVRRADRRAGCGLATSIRRSWRRPAISSPPR